MAGSTPPYRHPMTDKPPKSDARIGGMVATVVLVLLAVFVVVFVWMGT
jgi:hypothetical protein